MLYKNIIEKKIKESLNPISLEIIDESHKHKGHMGYSDKGETHFKLHIVSNKFIGLSKVARHKIVNNILKKELEEHVHALSLNLKSKEEV